MSPSRESNNGERSSIEAFVTYCSYPMRAKVMSNTIVTTVNEIDIEFTHTTHDAKMKMAGNTKTDL